MDSGKKSGLPYIWWQQVKTHGFRVRCFRVPRPTIHPEEYVDGRTYALAKVSLEQNSDAQFDYKQLGSDLFVDIQWLTGAKRREWGNGMIVIIVEHSSIPYV